MLPPLPPPTAPCRLIAAGSAVAGRLASSLVPPANVIGDSLELHAYGPPPRGYRSFRVLSGTPSANLARGDLATTVRWSITIASPIQCAQQRACPASVLQLGFSPRPLTPASPL
ncbi:uncharacterized protein TRAVEDRAFT_52615 [Trametes versicolor FP-101664 SS1]|uniref:uncharacterized protein n=1 Tax=Trametes versicolor (strain FP-101664) TaxID=717944 RepID=UPI0004621D3D|nr:uncharacterized protein TRAVEDRAFT_52615 [Trametes versicolor FP-101664 SS1]EIW53485.1 hypothetical protein TRAVEDRAFT_52615 [Trametes versicolor FP-101664 SS1]